MYFDAKEFGKRLKEVRKRRGLTQVNLAEILGLSNKQHISRIERGESSCSIDLLVDLSCVLHVSTDYLLKGEDSDRQKTKDNLLAVAAQLTQIAQEI